MIIEFMIPVKKSWYRDQQMYWRLRENELKIKCYAKNWANESSQILAWQH